MAQHSGRYPTVGPRDGQRDRGSSRLGVLFTGLIAVATLVIYYFAGYLPAERAASHERSQRALAGMTRNLEHTLDNLPDMLRNTLRPREDEDLLRHRRCDVRERLQSYQGMRLYGEAPTTCALTGQPVAVSPVAVVDEGEGAAGADTSLRYAVSWVPVGATERATFHVDVDLARVFPALDAAGLFDNVVVVRGIASLAQGGPAREPALIYRERAAGPLPLLPRQILAATAPDPPSTDREWAVTPQVGELHIGPSTYWVYGQPLMSDTLGASEAWGVFALMERRTLDAQIHKLPLQEILLVVVLFSIVVLLAPHLKLLVVGRREALRSADVHALLLAGALGAAVITLVVTGLGLRSELVDATRRVGTERAQALAAQVQQYAWVAADALDAFARQAESRLGLVSAHGDRCLKARGLMCDDSPSEMQPREYSGLLCMRDRSPLSRVGRLYHQMIWIDAEGWQLGKLTREGPNASPLIRVHDRPYFEQTKDGVFNTVVVPMECREPGTVRERRGLNIHGVKSRNSGFSTLAFSARLEHEALRPLGPVVQLTSSPEHVVSGLGLPEGMGYAVVDGRGDVLIHSDAHRTLTENLLRESENDPVLRAHLRSGSGGDVTVSYHQKPTDLYLEPVPGSELFAVVLVDRDLLSVTLTEVMLRAGTLAGWTLVATSLLALVLLAGGHANGRAWLWPASTATFRHPYTCLVLLLLAGAQLLLDDFHRGLPGLLLMFLVPMLALAAAHQCLAHGCKSRMRAQAAPVLTGALLLMSVTALASVHEALTTPAQRAATCLLLLGGLAPFAMPRLDAWITAHGITARPGPSALGYVACGVLLLGNTAILPAHAAVSDSERLAAQTWVVAGKARALHTDGDPTANGAPRGRACHTTGLALNTLGSSDVSARLGLSSLLAEHDARGVGHDVPCKQARSLAQVWPLPLHDGVWPPPNGTAPSQAGLVGLPELDLSFRPWLVVVWLLAALLWVGEAVLIAERVFGLRWPGQGNLHSALRESSSPAGLGRHTMLLHAGMLQRSKVMRGKGVARVDATTFTGETDLRQLDGAQHVVVFDLGAILRSRTAAHQLVLSLTEWMRDRDLRVTLFAERDPEELLAATDAKGDPLVSLDSADRETLWSLFSQFERKSSTPGGPAASLRAKLASIDGLSSEWQEELTRQCAFDVELHDTAVELGRDIVRHSLPCTHDNLRRVSQGVSSRVFARCRKAWHVRTLDEQFVLGHLAQEGFANPKTWETVARLEHLGLVFRDPSPRVGPDGLAEIASDELESLEAQSGSEGVRWRALRTPVLTVVLGLFLVVLVLEPMLGGSLLALLMPLATAATGVNKLMSNVTARASSGA